MARTAKNYNENGGDTTIIGGVLKIDGGEIQKADGTKLIANQAASVATDVTTLVADFNALLTKLKDAGLKVADV
jgi:hypothetical protein